MGNDFNIEDGQDSGAAIGGIGGNVGVTSIIPGTGATQLGKAQDSAVGATDTNVGIMLKRVDSLTAVTPAVGDYVIGTANQYGDQWVSLATALDAAIDSIAIGARVGVGCDTDVNLDVDEGAADVIKGTPGTLYGCIAVNRSSAIRYLRYYDAATATVGTTATKVLIPIPGDATIAHGVALFGDMGVKMATGICIGATTGFAANDTGAPGANDIIVTTLFK